MFGKKEKRFVVAEECALGLIPLLDEYGHVVIHKNFIEE